MLRSVYLLVQMAAIPAVAWTWFALIGRASGALRRPSPSVVRKPPSWEREGDEHLLRFRAVPLRMHALAGRIAAMVVVIGALVAVGLTATGDPAERVGPQLVIIVVGALIALPVYLLFLAVVRRRTVTCGVHFAADRVLLERR